MGAPKRFHSLDVLRFFAFFKVFIFHLPLEGNFTIFGYLRRGGGVGVTFFFVLSGFLISHILLKEKISKGKIDSRRFFFRRALRIWPLYFLILLLAYGMPYDWQSYLGLHMIGSGYMPDWKLSFTFLENYKMIMEDNLPRVTPLSTFWSLCIEEHFYILWMVLISYFKPKWIPYIFMFAIPVAIGARVIDHQYIANNTIHTNELFSNLDFFAIGGLLGWWVTTHYEGISSRIMAIPKWLQCFMLLSIVGLIVAESDVFKYLPGPLAYLKPTFLAIAFTTLIALFVPRDSHFRIRETNPLNYLGKISYGLYVYHLIFIHLVYQWCINQGIKLDQGYELFLFGLVTLLLSIICSALSFKYFEGYFLNLRKKWL